MIKFLLLLLFVLASHCFFPLLSLLRMGIRDIVVESDAVAEVAVDDVYLYISGLISKLIIGMKSAKNMEGFKVKKTSTEK